MDVEEQLLAPAKVNLRLRIVGRRPDGYHLLDSLIVPVSLYDDLTIRLRLPAARAGDPDQMIRVTSDSDDAPGGPSNLAHRAAAIFLTHIGLAMPVDITVRKRIPAGTGLGGGSSDAAAVLLALNRLLGAPLTTTELTQLGARIGADVPFFVCGSPARVEGVGERITPLGVSPLPLVLCWDRYPLSTKLVYARAKASLTSSPAVSNIADFVGGHGPSPELLINDLEEAAAQIHPEVLSLRTRLEEEGAVGALMTGSGAAVFGIWRDIVAAWDAATRLRLQGLWAEPVETLTMSPAVRS